MHIYTHEDLKFEIIEFFMKKLGDKGHEVMVELMNSHNFYDFACHVSIHSLAFPEDERNDFVDFWRSKLELLPNRAS